MSNVPVVLVVEDNVGDVLLFEEALEHARLKVELHEANNAVQAFTYLTAVKRGIVPKKPTFVLLDINMPIYRGFDVLRKVKEDPELKDIPVVVLTSASDEACRRACLEMGADDFVHKPLELAEYRETAARLARKYVG